MNNYRFHKKAVSPLIATVLLIAFAVALGAVVMSWGKTYVENTKDYADAQSGTQMKCAMDVSWGILTTSDMTTQLCKNAAGTNISFIVENKGAMNVTLNVSSMGGSAPGTSVSIVLAPGAATRSNITLGTGDNLIRFAPYVSYNGVTVICSKLVITRELSNINTC